MQISGYDSQIKELFTTVKQITIIGNQSINVDIIGAITALSNYLKRRDKEVKIYFPNINEMKDSEYQNFLQNVEDLPAQRTTIQINLDQKRIKKFSYEVKDGFLNVYLIPEKGLIQGDNVQVINERLQTDAIITVKIAKPEELDIWPTTWADDYKMRTPIINIDNNSQNSHYGSINIIDKSSSICQSIYLFMKQAGWEIDIDSAMHLLNGIKFVTSNFSINTSSDIFLIAAELTAIIEKEKEKH